MHEFLSLSTSFVSIGATLLCTNTRRSTNNHNKFNETLSIISRSLTLTLTRAHVKLLCVCVCVLYTMWVYECIRFDDDDIDSSGWVCWRIFPFRSWTTDTECTVWVWLYTFVVCCRFRCARFISSNFFFFVFFPQKYYYLPLILWVCVSQPFADSIPSRTVV